MVKLTALLLMLVAIIEVLGGLNMFWHNLYPDPWDKTDYNSKFIADNAVPTQISLIDDAANIISNPMILAILILAIVWLFGGFSNSK